MHAHDSSICILLTFNIVISMKLYWNYTFSEYSLIQSNSFSKNMVDYRVKFGRLTGCSLVLVHYYIGTGKLWRISKFGGYKAVAD